MFAAGLAFSRGAVHARGAHDEAFRRRPDVSEWIPRDERQLVDALRCQYIFLVRVDDAHGLDAVAECVLRNDDVNLIADFDVLERPEECVAMTGEHHVAAFSRTRGTGNETDCARESAIVGALFHDRFQSEPRDLDAADRGGIRGR